MADSAFDRIHHYPQLLKLAADEPEIAHLLRLAVFGKMTQPFIHEINNYFTGISGYTNLLIQTTGLNPKNREFIQKTQDCCNTVQSLNQTFRSLFPRKNKELSPADVSILMPEIVTFCGMILGASCTVTSDDSTDMLQLLSIPEWIFKDIVLYLILSANEMIDGSGDISIKTSVEYLQGEDRKENTGEWFIITLQPVYKPELSQSPSSVWESPAQRLVKSEDRLLSSLTWRLVNQSIEHCGGSVFLRRGDENAHYLIAHLPIAEEITQTEAPAVSQAVTVKRLDRPLNLVLLEDQELIGGFIRTLLERDGHHVQVFANGLEIDDILKTDALTGTDVFLLDICVPGRSGLEVGRLIREKNPDSKIVFYSALSDIETVQESFRLNNRTQFLRKPFKKEELIEMLELVMSAEA